MSPSDGEVRPLTQAEIDALREEMRRDGAWMKTELTKCETEDRDILSHCT